MKTTKTRIALLLTCALAAGGVVTPVPAAAQTSPPAPPEETAALAEPSPEESAAALEEARRRLDRFLSEVRGIEPPEAAAAAPTGAAGEDAPDPAAYEPAASEREAYERLGSPEGELAIAQVVLYLATAPKSNAGYVAFGEAQGAARETGSLMPPKHILNAPTRLMRDLGYGKGYAYDHDTEEGFSGQSYFPEEIERQLFYDPADRGFEREIRKRLDYWAKLRAAKSEQT